MNSWKYGGVVLAFYLFASVLYGPELSANERANASFYIATFGRVDRQQNPLAERAHGVFENLKRVAGSASATAELVLIDTASKPWAIALTDGNVVLSRGALEIIYTAGAAERGDAWLAFALGHELAHLGSRDLWQQHVFASLSALPNLDDSALSNVQQAMTQSVFDAEAWRERELKADELGYVIAALAGYEVEQIFGDEQNHQDFLEVWEASTGSVGNTHYSAEVRNEFLRVRLAAAEQRLDQFQLGLMLSHAGRLSDALTVFEDFQRYFSSRSVLSNLGYVHLQLAREEMPVQIAYRFWLPTLLEPDSGLRIPSRGFASGLSDRTLNHLKDASRYLEQARMMEPDDDVVSTNLAVAYQYLGKYFRARAVLEESLDRHPENQTLAMLKALILVDQEPEIDMWPRAVETLQTMERAAETSPTVLFNLARLHQERNRFGKAEVYWTRLNEQITTLPAAYRYQVCTGLGIDCQMPGELQSTIPDALNDLAKFPLHPGYSLQDDQVKSLVSATQWTRLQVQEIEVTIIKSENITGFALDGVLELVRYQSPHLQTVERVIAQLMPLDTSMLGTYRVVRYTSGLSVLEREGEPVELWVTR